MEYQNPVLAQDFPDPSSPVLGIDGWYYSFATNADQKNIQVLTHLAIPPTSSQFRAFGFLNLTLLLHLRVPHAPCAPGNLTARRHMSRHSAQVARAAAARLSPVPSILTGMHQHKHTESVF